MAMSRAFSKSAVNWRVAPSSDRAEFVPSDGTRNAATSAMMPMTMRSSSNVKAETNAGCEIGAEASGPHGG